MKSSRPGPACLSLLLLAAACGAVPARDSAPAARSAHARPARAQAEGQQGPATGAGGGPHDAAALAKQLSNPVAALISVPFQLNHDRDVGPSDGERWTLNVQPVVPISLSEDWNLISRTIVPLIDQEDVPAGEDET
ncbi:MAG TPA: hypothetical protein VF530_15900, partial [Planctomycetota bacterium]